MLYLDNAATSLPKPETVLQAWQRLLPDALGNPGRSGHRLSLASAAILADCRQKLATLIGSEGPERIGFTLNGTDSLNAAIKGILRPGDHVVTGVLEHNSVVRPLHGLSQDASVQVSTISCDDEGYYEPADVEAAITDATRLVVLTHASNVLGTVQPIAAIGAICRQHDVLLLVDAAQTAGGWPIDVREESIDILAVPGHKSLYGPMGTGFLYVGPRTVLRPWREGGTGGDSVSLDHPRDLPMVLEGGTPNVPGIAMLAAGAEYVMETGIAAIRERQQTLARELVEGLQSVPGLELMAPPGHRDRVPVVSFRLPLIEPEDLAAILDESFEIAVRAGLHCAPGTHRRFGTFPSGMVRVSPSPLSPADAVPRLTTALRAIAGALR
jgi:cysteine desulfurase family protein